MAVTAFIFPKMWAAALNKEIDVLDDTHKVALLTSTASPDQDTWDYYNDLTNELSTGSGYTSGGATLANDTLTYTAGSNLYTYDADDVSWSSSTLTARYAILYDDTPALSSAKPLEVCVNFGADVSSTSATFAIQWHASGIWTLTTS